MKQELVIQIPAVNNGQPGIYTLHAPFHVFACIATDGTYSAQGNPSTDSPIIIDSAGRGFGTKAGKQYAGIVFQNFTGAIVNTTIYLGDDALPQSFIANSVAVVANVGVTALAPGQILKTVAAAGTAVAISGNQVVRSLLLLAFKTLAGGANTGNISIGMSGAGTNQPIILAPGDTYQIPIAALTSINLNAVFVNALNNGDGVIAIYS